MNREEVGKLPQDLLISESLDVDPADCVLFEQALQLSHRSDVVFLQVL